MFDEMTFELLEKLVIKAARDQVIKAAKDLGRPRRRGLSAAFWRRGPAGSRDSGAALLSRVIAARPGPHRHETRRGSPGNWNTCDRHLTVFMHS